MDDYNKKQINISLGMQTMQNVDKTFLSSHLA